MTPTERSLKKLRDEGWLVAVVEKWNPFVRRRQDLFGFADLLAVKDDTALLVQTTTTGVSERLKKILGIQAHELWLASPNRQIHVHGWRKIKVKRGGKAMRWDCRVVDVREEKGKEVRDE